MKRNPRKKIKANLLELLKRWSIRGHIDNKTYYQLKPSDNLLLKAHGLPKVHKKDIPLRIIISSINSSLYSFSSFFTQNYF